MTHDLLIRNGRVVDGSGEPAFQADVAVHQGGSSGSASTLGAAKRTIDAAGRVVAPGFIDHHTHFDPQAVWDPYCGSWVHNGHTTVVVGQCGQVIAPVRPGDAEWYLEFFSDAEQIPLPVLKAGVDVTWESVGDYLERARQKARHQCRHADRPFRHPPLCDGRGVRPARQGHRGRNGGDAAADPRGDV